LYIFAVYFHKFNPGVDRWQLLTTHTSKSLCEPYMRISMFNCVVSQSLSAINSAADSIKIISTDLWVFLSFEFFRKFAEIFAAQGLPPVSTTQVANGKNLQSEKF
jgi:hypothetical protein